MSTHMQKSQILAKIRSDKEFRDNFVAEQIYSRLPLKIRNMRVARKLKQKQLAEKAAVAPEWITQVENPNYGRFTLKTLLKIAAAFDVGLCVDFVPYSKVVNDTLALSNDSFNVPGSEEDVGLLERIGPSGEQTPVRVASMAMAAGMGGFGSDQMKFSTTVHVGSSTAITEMADAGMVLTSPLGGKQ